MSTRIYYVLVLSMLLAWWPSSGAQEFIFKGHTEINFRHIQVHGDEQDVDNFRAYNADDPVDTSYSTNIYFDMYEDGDKRAEIEIDKEQKKLKQHRLSWFKRDAVVWEFGQRLDVNFSDVFLRSESYSGFAYNYEYLTPRNETFLSLVHGRIGDVEQKGLEQSHLFGMKLSRQLRPCLNSSLMLGQIGRQAVLAMHNIWQPADNTTLDIQYAVSDTDEIWLNSKIDSAFRSRLKHEREKFDIQLEYNRVGASYLDIPNVNMEKDIDKRGVSATYKFQPTTFVTAGKALSQDAVNNPDKDFSTRTMDNNIMFAHMPGKDLGYLYYWSLSNAWAPDDAVDRSTHVIMNRATYTLPRSTISLSKMWINIGDRISDFTYRSDMGGIGYDVKVTDRLRWNIGKEMTKVDMAIGANTPVFTLNRTFKTGLSYAMGEQHLVSCEFNWNNSRENSDNFAGMVKEEKRVVTTTYEKNISSAEKFVFRYNLIKHDHADETAGYFSDDIEFSFRRMF